MEGGSNAEAEYTRIGRVDDFAEGEGRTVEVAGAWVAVFRTAGRFYAIDNACPHMAGPLGAGSLEGSVVTCPLHHWRIDVRTGVSPTNEHVRVACYEIQVQDGWVTIRLGRRASQ